MLRSAGDAMAESKGSRNNNKYSADRRDHLRATEFRPEIKGYYVGMSIGQKWSVFSKRTNTKVATFDKAKQAHKWLADRVAADRAANEARKIENLGERLGSENPK